MVRARELGLKVYHRSDILAEISRWGKFFLGDQELTEKQQQVDFLHM